MRSKSVFIVANFFGFWNEKILDLANNIILAIKILKIISVDDKVSMMENWVIDHALLDEINHNIDIGTMISSEAILTHQ